MRLLPGGRMFAVRDEDLPRAIGFPLVLASLVLVMACGNVANMLLARSTARRREIAVRISLGASRGRIVRQLLTESILLAVMGAAAGLAFAWWLLSGIESMRPLIPDYGYFDVRFDWQALTLAILVAAGAGVLFGLAPALRASREDIYAGLKPHASVSGNPRRLINLRNVLVFQQVTASIVLVLLTGFVVVGWQRTATVDNETMAREVWPGDEPVGKTVDFDGARWQVIGVVGDIRPAFPLAPTRPAVYRRLPRPASRRHQRMA